MMPAVKQGSKASHQDLFSLSDGLALSKKTFHAGENFEVKIEHDFYWEKTNNISTKHLLRHRWKYNLPCLILQTNIITCGQYIYRFSMAAIVLLIIHSICPMLTLQTRQTC